jgi:hypothetical protein
VPLAFISFDHELNEADLARFIEEKGACSEPSMWSTGLWLPGDLELTGTRWCIRESVGATSWSCRSPMG